MVFFNDFIVLLIVIFMLNSRISGEVQHGDYNLDDELTYGAVKNLNDGDYELIQFWSGNRRTPRGIQREIRYKREAPQLHSVVRVGGHNLIREKTPVWVARKNKPLERVDDTVLKEAIRYYEDPGVMQLYEVKYDANSNAYFTGRIAKRSVRPLSDSAIRILKETKPHLFNNTLPPGTVDGDFVLSPYHVLSKANDDNEKVDKVLHDLLEESKYNGQMKHYHKLKRSVDTVYPEILVVVDFGQKFSSIREFRFFELLIYVIGFWNSVNLRYGTLTKPAIQLRIAGIVINMEREALPFIKSSLDSIPKYLIADNVIHQVPHWLSSQNTIPLTDFDMVLTMTNKRLCSLATPTSKCSQRSSRLLGLATTGLQCVDKLFMTGVFHDKYDYSGVMVAAHELAHILGAHHDNKTYGISCSPDNGFMMADIVDSTKVDRSFQWSPCSINDLERNLYNNSGTFCFHNSDPVSDQGKIIKDIFPGEKISLKRQCRQYGYSSWCKTPTMCAVLECRKKAGKCTRTKYSALEGSPCGAGRRCMGGVCEKTLQGTVGGS